MKETLEALDMACFRSQDCSQASEATQPPSQAPNLRTTNPTALTSRSVLNSKPHTWRFGTSNCSAAAEGNI